MLRRQVTAGSPPPAPLRPPPARMAERRAPNLIALGDSIFHGQVGGGTCYACHGQDAQGSAVATNLTDGEWLNTDGSLDGITKTVQSRCAGAKEGSCTDASHGRGIAHPADQVRRAVAAYVAFVERRGEEGG